MTRLLRYLWAFPATAIGLGLALIGSLTGSKLAWIDGVLEVGDGCLGHVILRLPSSLQFSAITFGHVVIGVDRKALVDARPHERVHVRQYERWGVLFIPLYLASSLFQLLRGRDPYWHNRFEREAYREERKRNDL